MSLLGIFLFYFSISISSLILLTYSNKRVSQVVQWERFCLQCRRHKFDPWVGKIPWSRKWQLTSVFLPGKFHGERSLAGYSSWGHKESDMTEQLNTHIATSVKNYWTTFTYSLPRAWFAFSRLTLRITLWAGLWFPFRKWESWELREVKRLFQDDSAMKWRNVNWNTGYAFIDCLTRVGDGFSNLEGPLPFSFGLWSQSWVMNTPFSL